MTLIRIRAYTAPAEGFEAAVSFDDGTEYPIIIQDPFSQKEEAQLEWYFEEWLQFPFIRQVEAHQAAASIAVYGETLFKQVFADPEAYARYKEVLQAGLNLLQVEILASPKSAQFHALHWEALKDPRLPQPLAVQATMMRKNLVPQVIRASVHPSPTINVLVVTARPFGKRDVGYRTISRPLVENLRQTDIPVQVAILRPSTYRALDQHLQEISSRHGVGYYHVIHFDVHGAVVTYDDFQQEQEPTRYLYQQRYGRADLAEYEGYKAFLFLEGERDNQADPVEAAELADLLINHQVPIAILNACQSGKQVGTSESSLGSRLMQAGVQLVLAMGYSVTVSAAELLMRTLYQQLFAKQDLSTSIRRGRQELYNQKERRAYFNQTIELEDWLLPVVYQNQEQRLLVRPFTPEEQRSYHGRRTARYKATQPRYGFVGRDLDILQLERRLLTKRNLVLVQGMGGAGKTTLLSHLGAWWQTTGLVDQVYYFGYDEKAWSRQQLMTSIAGQLLSKQQYHDEFRPLELEAQQDLLTGRLRAERHLLILDNLESITGAQLAIQHTLPVKEQQALHDVLADLMGGRTLVLLGSRSKEEWLALGTFEDNVYELGGLDSEAASILAERILERQQATRYRQEPDFQHLLKLLDGFPLALEVVLSNLARQTPTQVLSALQAGDTTMKTGDSQKRTENILRCIDYSHSNLSPEAQQLLLCLAPFTSVLWQDQLEDYTTALQQQPLLAALPFARWPEVIREATNWGLLSPDPDLPGFLRLQPTLPYFLRSRLQAPEQVEVRKAVEIAFRQLYDLVGALLCQLLVSKEPQDRQAGQVLTGLEYENLVMALDLALAAQDSILYPYLTLSMYLEATEDQPRGLELVQSVLSRMECYPTDKLVGQLGIEFTDVIHNIATWQLMLKQYAAAQASYQKALSLLQENKGLDAQTIEKEIASTYYQLGIVAQKQRQWQQAEQYYQQALQIYIKYNDRYRQAQTYYQLGMMAKEQRQYEQAKQYGQQALQIFIEIKDRLDQALTYDLLGIVAQAQQQYKRAKQHHKKALEIKIAFNDRPAQALTYHNLGELAQEQRQYEQAQQYYQQALQIYIEYNDRYRQALTYYQLGMVAAQEQRQYKQAQQYGQQALQIYIEYNDRYGQALTYHQLGIVAQAQGQWQQAQEYLLRALETYIAYQDDYGRGIVVSSLARLWQSSGDAGLPAKIASILHSTPAKVEALLRDSLGNESGEGKG